MTEGHQRVLTRQAEELRRLFGPELRPTAAQALDEFLGAESSLGGRLQYVMLGTAHRQRVLDDLIYRALYLARRV